MERKSRSEVFFWLEWSFGFGRWGKVLLSSYHITSCVHTTNMTFCWWWPWPCGWGVFVKSPCLLYYSLLKEATVCSPHWRGREVGPPSWRKVFIEILWFFCAGNLSLLLYLVFHLCQHGFRDMHFTMWVIIYYCFICVFATSVQLWPVLSVDTCVPLTYPQLYVFFVCISSTLSLVLQSAPGSSWIFPTVVLESAISAVSPGFQS